jgi:hypothetical protein
MNVLPEITVVLIKRVEITLGHIIASAEALENF